MTLIGPGGAGKTRLAVETAATLQPEYRDGAWLVELAAVRDPEAVAAAVIIALGAGGPGSAEGAGATAPAVGVLLGHLRGRSLVIVLDNCEHVVAAAATVIEALLGEIPDLLVIATSREPLGVSGEALFPVGGLDADAAVELFADRGSAVRASFTIDADTEPIVAELCRRLDHLPLALELAAARLRVLPLTQLAGLLDDRFRVLTGGSRTALPRHQTLRAVVDWSHDLLFDDERRLFARLSVFTGGCGSRRRRVGVRRRRPRSHRHPRPPRAGSSTSRWSSPSSTSRATCATRSCRHCGSTGANAWPTSGEAGDRASIATRTGSWPSVSRRASGSAGEDGLVWQARFGAELGNLRGALDWYIEGGDATSALSLTTGLAWVWFQRSDFHNAARWLEDALRVTGDAPADACGPRRWAGTPTSTPGSRAVRPRSSPRWAGRSRSCATDPIKNVWLMRC